MASYLTFTYISNNVDAIFRNHNYLKKYSKLFDDNSRRILLYLEVLNDDVLKTNNTYINYIKRMHDKKALELYIDEDIKLSISTNKLISFENLSGEIILLESDKIPDDKSELINLLNHKFEDKIEGKMIIVAGKNYGINELDKLIENNISKIYIL